MGLYKAYFTRRFTEAKEVITEPSQPKVTLRLSAKTPEPTPKITLRFGQKTAPDLSNGVSVDSEAYKRQQDHVKAGVIGQKATTNGGTSTLPVIKNQNSGSDLITSTSQISVSGQTNQERRSGSAPVSPDPANGVKNESQPAQASTIIAVSGSNGSRPSNETSQSPKLTCTNMLPPASLTPRLPSGSPHPQVNHVPHNNYLHNPLDSRWRQPGKGTVLFLW